MLNNTINLIWKEKKLVNRSKLITQQPKTFENPNIVYRESVTIEHQKTSCEFFKTVRQVEKAFQVSGADKNSNSSLYSETKKQTFLEKIVKTTKQSHAY